jgi:hypothetical protein
MLTTQTGADLAVALAGEQRAGPDSADQHDQLIVTDHGRRSRSWRPPRPAAPGVHRGAVRAQHPAHRRDRPLLLHGYLGRFAGGICSPLFFGRRPQDLVLHSQLPDLAPP